MRCHEPHGSSVVLLFGVLRSVTLGNDAKPPHANSGVSNNAKVSFNPPVVP